jgi:hypothetical protein
MARLITVLLLFASLGWAQDETTLEHACWSDGQWDVCPPESITNLGGFGSGSIADTDITAGDWSKRTEHAERTVRVDSSWYIVVYDYNANFSWGVSTVPPPPPHYPATISVYRLDGDGKMLIRDEMEGTYVPGDGCFEDDPEHWVREALAKPITAKELRQREDRAVRIAELEGKIAVLESQIREIKSEVRTLERTLDTIDK